MPPDAPLPLPCIPVVVLNGTSHQPAVASSILNIWRAADLEELSELPRLEEMLPGVVHPPPLPLRTSSGGSGSHHHSSWPCLAPLGGDSGLLEGPWGYPSAATGGGALPGGGMAGGFIPHSCPASLASCLLPDELVLLQAGSIPAPLASPLAAAGGSSTPQLFAPQQDLVEQQQQEEVVVASGQPAAATPSTSSKTDAAGPALSTSSAGSGGGSSMEAGSQPGAPGVTSSPSGASPSSSSSWLTTWLADRETTPPGDATDATSGDPGASPGSLEGWDTGLHLPLWVSDQERQQMEARLDGWVEQLLAVGANVRGLAAQLSKPLRPLWVSQDSLIWTNQVRRPGGVWEGAVGSRGNGEQWGGVRVMHVA